MLYHLASYLQPYLPALNVVHYVSFRALASLLSTLCFSFAFGNWFILHSQRLFRSKTREFTPETHRIKDNLPTMGGLFILCAVTLNMLLWCDLTQPRVWLLLVCLLGFGAIGAWDDWCKISRKKGISARLKFWLQVSVALIVTGGWLYFTGAPTTISLPFLKNIKPDLGIFFLVWAIFLLVATSNAVNLTDGLDGLAIGSLILNFGTFVLIAYVAGHATLAAYLQIPWAETAELAVATSILMGASLGFLWYNTYPAQIFMGDVGSLALGAGLAFIALMTKQELLLAISGGLFVLETVSVILQVLSFKFRGRRMFKMAPIHHHFELLGWPESKITVRFGIISFVLCLLALITLKLR
jgi:phospho-N-acetylmuramoyl-pentapeptide-transferase